MLRRIANIAEEPVAPIIERTTEAGAAGKQLHLASAGIKPEITSRHNERCCVGLIAGLNSGAVAAAGTINLVIEAPDEIVHHGLHVVLAEARKHFASLVGLPIA